MSTQVFFAPVGTSPTDREAWTSFSAKGVEFTTMSIDEASDWHLKPGDLTTHSMSLSFTITRRDVRRLRQAFPYSLAELRRSARWSEYHRRQKRRSR